MFVTALMARRAQEMRLTARSMTEVAIRLAEPETVATEQVVTLSQAIRREVASLGDGIERALARASELETMMRSEVSNLERSYSDNERRIRSLIDGLSQQREEIVINSEKVRTAIVGAHESLSRDLATTSVRLADSVSEAGSRVTATLGSKSEEIAFALSRTGSDLVQNLPARPRPRR
jgi:DNA repair exonuclease SbcCD ATPase subunit